MEKQKSIPRLRFSKFDGVWVQKRLGEIFSISAGGDIQQKNVSQTKTEIFKYPIYANAEKSKGLYGYADIYKIEEGVVTVAGRGVNIGIAHARNHKFYPIVRLLVLKPKNSEDIYFFEYQINKINLFKESTGVPQLTAPQVSNYKIYYPLIPEQQKIASFFTSIDQKITQLKQKKTLLEQYKKGVMQKLFSQEIRFKDDNGQEFPKWEKKKLGGVIDEYRVITKTNNEYEVLTSSNKGLMLQKEYYGENRITERDNIGFNVLPNGYITYRSRSDNGIFTFNLNNLGITGIVSKYYPVFKIKDGSNYLLVEFLNDNYKIISQYSIGTSQKVFPMNAFNNISLSIPCPREQTKIADFLTAIDDKINHTKKQIEKAEVWKKGLLQQMFV